MGRNNADFQGYSLRYRQDSEGDHDIIAEHPSENEPVGFLTWSNDDGEILDAHVAPEHRRKGLATAMFRHANKVAVENRLTFPQMSENRTDDGELWAKSLGVDLPKRKKASY